MTGFIVIDKQKGVSSAHEVNMIKRISGVSCGHMGTLDPMASGVLPIALGNAARLFDYFLGKKKRYIAEFSFGIDSDTLDTTGTVIRTGGYVPDEKEITDILPELCGEVMQIPPKFSAKNVNGKRGYELARAGIDFELKPKKVNIYGIKLLKRTSDNSFSFEINCGGGTYIRSIARDLAQKLNTCAVMSSLIREASGCFELKDAIKSQNLNKDNIKDFIIATDSVLPFESVYPSLNDAKKLFNGVEVDCSLKDGIYKIYFTDGSFYGLAEAKHSKLKVRTKLC